ncbi:hypothetical protein CO111_00260 [Candidatus Desantisbacteria bacterium CG_4_9_14_3_um_filter_50_7]|nr:MAG: hypothetical protein CO111_00260 [Candidatus Desantisbacteria bacterium CG_4_9_14_3_um_filter_50_7]
MKQIKPTKHTKISFYLGLIVIAFMSFAILADLFGVLRLKGIDFYFTIRPQITPRSDIVIVTIDDMSIKELGVWPWPRRYHAEVLDFLTRAKAKVVGFDILFADNAPDPEDDRLLIDAARKAKNVYFAMFFSPQKRKRAETKKVSIVVTTEKEKAVEEFLPRFAVTRLGTSDTPTGGQEVTIPITDLSKCSKGIGNINYEPDEDGVIRYGQLIVGYKGNYYPALSLCLAAGSMGLSIDQIKVGRYIKLKDDIVPISRQGKILVNYVGPFDKFKTIPYYRVLTGEMPESAFKDKIVLVGSTATGVYDLRVTPFSANFPGVGVHANIINSILTRKYIRALPPVLGLMFVIGFGLLLGYALPRLSPLLKAVFAASLFAVLVTTGVVFFNNNIYMDIVYPGMAVLFSYFTISLYLFIAEEREKREVKGAFSKYVNPEVMEEILSAPEKLQLGGTKKKLTILFADVRGFTPISEKLQPEEVVSLLNECLTEMADAIFKHEGTLDKFIGDAVLAFFGAPVEHTDDPQRAVRTAWEMQQRIDVVNKRREGGTHGLLKIGIGINTGDVVVGNVGSHRRMDYTVIGDNVNLGQRLEDTAGGGQILISESTYELVKDIVDAVKLEPIKVKGRVQPVQIYEIHGVR